VNSYITYDAPRYNDAARFYLVYDEEIDHYKIPVALVEKSTFSVFTRLVGNITDLISCHMPLSEFKTRCYEDTKSFVKYRGGTYIYIDNIIDDLAVDIDLPDGKITNTELKLIKSRLLSSVKTYLNKVIYDHQDAICSIELYANKSGLKLT
jgi:hypothetical protein